LPLGNCRCHGLHSIAELPTHPLQRWKYKCSPKTTKTFAQLRETGIVIGQTCSNAIRTKEKRPCKHMHTLRRIFNATKIQSYGMPPVKKENSESPWSGRYKSSVRLKQAAQMPH